MEISNKTRATYNMNYTNMMLHITESRQKNINSIIPFILSLKIDKIKLYILEMQTQKVKPQRK